MYGKDRMHAAVFTPKMTRPEDLDPEMANAKKTANDLKKARDILRGQVKRRGLKLKRG